LAGRLHFGREALDDCKIRIEHMFSRLDAEPHEWFEMLDTNLHTINSATEDLTRLVRADRNSNRFIRQCLVLVNARPNRNEPWLEAAAPEIRFYQAFQSRRIRASLGCRMACRQGILHLLSNQADRKDDKAYQFNSWRWLAVIPRIFHRHREVSS
jgi:hypothetical protein